MLQYCLPPLHFHLEKATDGTYRFNIFSFEQWEEAGNTDSNSRVVNKGENRDDSSSFLIIEEGDEVCTYLTFLLIDVRIFSY